MPAVQKYTVVILGAGASGLYAAYNLAKRGFTNIIVVEAQDRVGGRIHTIDHGEDVLELGAQWIHGRGDNPLWKFVVENKVIIKNL